MASSQATLTRQIKESCTVKGHSSKQGISHRKTVRPIPKRIDHAPVKTIAGRLTSRFPAEMDRVRNQEKPCWPRPWAWSFKRVLNARQCPAGCRGIINRSAKRVVNEPVRHGPSPNGDSDFNQQQQLTTTRDGRHRKTKVGIRTEKSGWSRFLKPMDKASN